MAKAWSCNWSDAKPNLNLIRMAWIANIAESEQRGFSWLKHGVTIGLMLSQVLNLIRMAWTANIAESEQTRNSNIRRSFNMLLLVSYVHDVALHIPNIILN